LEQNQLNRMSIPKRYERKFLISDMDVKNIETVVKLNPYTFNEIYYERNINNIYFDTEDHINYFDNINGCFDRIKVRIRWYGDLYQNIEEPMLELKIKEGSLGYKKTFKLNKFNLSEGSRNDSILISLKESGLPKEISDMIKSCRPILINRYKRKYFESACHHYRITIDSELTYFPIDKQANTSHIKYRDFDNKVLELKYNSDKDKFASKISTKFPFIMTKSSKYVMGIERLYK